MRVFERPSRAWRTRATRAEAIVRRCTLPCMLVAFSGLAVGLASASSHRGAAEKLEASIIATGERQRSVHYVSNSTFRGQTTTEVGDVTQNSGIENITVTDPPLDVGYLTVVRVGGDVYLRGDAYGLVHYEGFTEAAAVEEADAWMQILPSSQFYESTAT